MTSYATISEADAILQAEPWVSLDSDNKQYALDIGTLWIDEKYYCTVDFVIPETLQRANILLADMQVRGSLFVAKEGEIISKSVSAKSVSTSKTYSDGTQLGVNPFAEIELLLNTVCMKVNSGIISTKRV
jgi:hypothetical protein